MATVRVLNVTTGLHHKLSQAENWISDGSHIWVERFKTIRRLSLSERVARRAEIAQHQEPIAFAENPGLKVIWSTPAQQATQRHSYQLIAQANKFCLEHA